MTGGGGGLCIGLSSFYSILPSFCFPHPVLHTLLCVLYFLKSGMGFNMHDKSCSCIHAHYALN